MTTTTAPDNSLSLDRILRLRAEGFAHVRHHNAMILSLATAIETLDAALMSATERNVDELQSLVSAAGKLAALIDGSAGEI